MSMAYTGGVHSKESRKGNQARLRVAQQIISLGVYAYTTSELHSNALFGWPIELLTKA